MHVVEQAGYAVGALIFAGAIVWRLGYTMCWKVLTAAGSVISLPTRR
jgi:hypothetical protein